ncbi:MAG: HAD family hydrolase [Actinomycetes bacterium]
MSRPSAVVFDIGNVLLTWDPRRLYRRLLPDEEAVEHFLTTVCTLEWNSAQDAGRPWAEGVATLVAEHPEHRDLIEAYDTRWEDMVGGPIEGSVAVLDELRTAGVPVFAITNFSVEKFSVTRSRFDFLGWFGDIVLSGEEGVVKPDPEIFRRALARFAVKAEEAVFVDDTPVNVEAAAALGMTGLHFTDPAGMRRAFVRLGLLGA